MSCFCICFSCCTKQRIGQRSLNRDQVKIYGKRAEDILMAAVEYIVQSLNIGNGVGSV